ncbi:GNAT family N-acetyltransferase [Pedobacter westerhofensis]|nr:GNAT family N-acetyltransferase [Pedobacter westerhofensis]
MKQEIITDRLMLSALQITDAEFIFDLLNSPGWLQFVGDRNIRDIKDAEAYIKKIQDNPLTKFWTVKLKDDARPMGIVSYVKREYLTEHDLGFAFLPAYVKQGYAYEASRAVLHSLASKDAPVKILAITAMNNLSSVRLLDKLGFVFDSQIEVEERKLRLYKFIKGGN